MWSKSLVTRDPITSTTSEEGPWPHFPAQHEEGPRGAAQLHRMSHGLEPRSPCTTNTG